MIWKRTACLNAYRVSSEPDCRLPTCRGSLHRSPTCKSDLQAPPDNTDGLRGPGAAARHLRSTGLVPPGDSTHGQISSSSPPA